MMKRKFISLIVMIMCVTSLVSMEIFCQPITSASSQSGEKITFEGLFERKTSMSVDDLKKLEKRYVPVTMVGSHKGYIGEFVYAGASLKEAMLVAGYRGTRGANVSCEDYIRAIGKDGYGIILSWGEVFNQVSGEDIILAYEKNGKPLDREEGPVRLIVPGDYYCGRYVKGVTKVVALTGYKLPQKRN